MIWVIRAAGWTWPWRLRARRAQLEAALDAARDAATAARARSGEADEQLAAAVTAYNQTRKQRGA